MNKVRALLPHRPPFLLVDKIYEVTDDIVIGCKNVTMIEPFSVGHFPEEPILPGVYSIECMAQAVDILLMSTLRYAGKTPLLLGVDKVSFRKKILPGDTLEIHANIISEKREKAIVTCAAEVYVHQERVANGDITIAMR